MIRRFVLATVVALFLGLAAAASGRPPGTVVLTRLAPPPDGQAYFGFTFRLWDTTDPLWGDTRPFSVRIADSIRNELAGKRPTFLTVYAPWTNPNGTRATFNGLRPYIAKVTSVTAKPTLLYLDWTFVATGDPATYRGVTTRDVAAGRLDRYIEKYAKQVKAYRRPVLVRLFGGEFNGSWWVSVSPLANPKLTAADFVRAWRRVVLIFRKVGALNVSWAWVPNAFGPSPLPSVDPNLAAYYPGNAYVDWAGADLYDSGPPSSLDGAYSFAVAHHKPFFLAEWGVRHASSTLTPLEDQAWLNEMLITWKHIRLSRRLPISTTRRQKTRHLPGMCSSTEGR